MAEQSDQDVMDPGELNPDDQDQAPVVGSQVTIGGTTFLVNEELAKALKGEQDQVRDQLRGLSRTVEEIRNAPRIPDTGARPVTEESVAGRYDEEIWSSPTAVLDKFGSEIEERITKRLTQAYQQDRQRENLWDRFYRDNPELKEHKTIVNGIVNDPDVMSEIGAMETGQGLEALAERSMKELMRIRGEKPSSGSRPVEAPSGEPVSGLPPQQARGTANQQDQVVTLASVLRKRRQERRKARASGG